MHCFSSNSGQGREIFAARSSSIWKTLSSTWRGVFELPEGTVPRQSVNAALKSSVAALTLRKTASAPGTVHKNWATHHSSFSSFECTPSWGTSMHSAIKEHPLLRWSHVHAQKGGQQDQQHENWPEERGAPPSLPPLPSSPTLLSPFSRMLNSPEPTRHALAVTKGQKPTRDITARRRSDATYETWRGLQVPRWLFGATVCDSANVKSRKTSAGGAGPSRVYGWCDSFLRQRTWGRTTEEKQSPVAHTPAMALPPVHTPLNGKKTTRAQGGSHPFSPAQV